MIRTLPAYYEHMDTFRTSFIAKIYGIFSIKIDKFDAIHVLIMQNSLPNIPDTSLDFIFDIKGSTINREVLKHDNEYLKKMKPTGGEVLKDLDYIRLKEAKKFMQLG